MPGAAPVPQLAEIACWRFSPGARPSWQGGMLGYDADAGGWSWDDATEPDAAGRDVPCALWTPPMLDAHTHLGDAFLRPERATLPRDLAALVAPPHGVKHRRLANTPADTVRAAMRSRLDTMSALGTAHAVDFREGGEAGARMLAAVADGHAPSVSVLARPAAPATSGDMWLSEVEALLATPVAGIGLSALRDLPARLADTAAQLCREAHKPIALHLSEGNRESMADALALNPSLLVHLVHANTQDLAAMADAQALAVACPTSNAFFGAKAPVAALFDAYTDYDLPVAFGTDNAMLSNGDLKDEIGLAAALCPRATTDFVMRSLTWTPWKHLELGPDPSDPGLLWGVHRKAPRQHPMESTLAAAAALFADGPFQAPHVGP